MPNPPITSDLDQAAAAYRAALLRRDTAALKRLMAAYQPAYTRMQARVDALLVQIAEAQAAGEPVRPSWLREKNRLATLQRQIVAEWASYATIAAQVITEAQRAEVVAAVQDAAALTQAALVDAGVTVGANLAVLNTKAMQELVGVLGDGSPLKTLLDALGVQAAQDVGDALKHAIAVGRNPRQTAKDIRAALGGNLNRALTIARTEQIRAYRNASLQTYQANSDILRGWQWRASPSRRTCPLCLAMDGSEHPLEEAFASHPACRCTPTPLLRNRPTPTRETGAQWLAKQDAATQRAMLGPGAYDLYREGKIALGDLVEVRNDPRWGPTLRRRKLEDALRAGEGRRSFRSNLPNDPPPPSDNLPMVALGLDRVQSLRGMERIRAAEMAIVDHPVEYGFGYDRHGNVVVNRRGEAREFRLTDEEVRQLQGGIFTHNHPSDGSFSNADVLLLHHLQLTELRVIGRGDDGVVYRYSVRPDQAFYRLDQTTIESVLGYAVDRGLRQARKQRDQFPTQQAAARWYLDRAMRYTEIILRTRHQVGFGYTQEVVNG